MIDFDAFETFLIVDEGKASLTVGRIMPRLQRMVRWGLDVERFARSATDAKAAGRAYLKWRRPRATVHAYNNDVKVLAALARFLEHDGLRFTYLTEPRVQKRALTVDQVRQLFTYESADRIEHRRNRALLLIALKTGMRASEIAAMDVSDLDAKRARVFVRKPAKGGLRRWLPVERWVFSPKRPLAAWLAIRPVPKRDPNALWTTSHKSGGGSYVPGADPARRVSSDYLRTSLYDVGKATGIPVNFNITRHTRGTELRKRGWDLLFIKEYLGHASVKSTEVYAEADAEDVDAMLRRRPGFDFFSDME